MKRGTNRRQWLLGIVGALFGAGAAQAVERLWPAPLDPASRPRRRGWLSWLRPEDSPNSVATYIPIEGKVEITPGPGDAEVTIAVYGAQGQLLERLTTRTERLEYCLPASPVWGSYSYTSGALLTTTSSTGAVTTFTYDSETGLRIG